MKYVMVVLAMAIFIAFIGGCTTTCPKGDHVCVAKAKALEQEEFQRFVDRQTPY